jgi:HD-GYP domain-containing protein (c-di-GMP phosphodiesterase class II)
VETNEVEMIAIPIKDFISASKLPVDIFVRLVGGRYVQVAKAGEAVSVNRLLNYESKKVDKLYVRKGDYSSYVDQNLTIAGITLTRSDLDNKKKSVFITQVANTVAQEMDDLGLNQETYVHARSITRVAMDLVQTKVPFHNILDALNNSSNDVFAHSIGTSVMSVMIGQTLGWSQQTVLEKLALGGMLHDVGMKDLPPEMITKNIAEMSYEERRDFEIHPFKGVEALKAIGEGLVPEDVLAIVYEHHENAIGQGFPRRLKSLRIHPLARVVGLADVFCDLTIKSPTTKRLRPVGEAMNYLEKTYGQLYPKDLLQALHSCLISGQAIKKAS